jgi:pyridoxal phosphate enzyme (YggS family)
MVSQNPTISDADNGLNLIRDRISRACRQSNRESGSVILLAASKSQNAARILAAFRCGQTVFGENYAQELAAKARDLHESNINWHFIGRIQSNKIKLIAQYANCVQTIDNIRHAKLLHQELRILNKLPFPIFIEVNCGDEAQKSGIPIGEVENLAAVIGRECPGLEIQGIMAIPPAKLSEVASAGEVPEIYRILRKLADHVGCQKLSLGMSSDLESAIAAGSTLVRVGTAIFGPRQ